MDAPGSERKIRRSHRANAARGRGQPCTQQGIIAGDVDFPRTEYDERKAMQPTRAALATANPRKRPITDTASWQDANLVYAPLGTPDCFQAMQGEIAITAVDEFGMIERNPVSQDNSLAVTTTVNGWPIGKDAQFAGVVRNARPLRSQDAKGTLVYTGTQTVVNTGPYEIMTGNDVYFSLSPHSVVENGHMSNAIEIDEAGQPGHHGATNEAGEHNAKFKVATYPLTDVSIYTYLRKGCKIADNFFAAEEKKTKPDAFNKIWLEKCLAAITNEYSEHEKEMPSKYYFIMHIAGNAARYISTFGKDAKLALAAWESVEEFAGSYYSRCTDNRKKYQQALGLNEKEDQDYRPAKKFRTSSGSAVITAEDMGRLFCKLGRQIDQAKLELECEQQNWMRRHLIGKCIRGNTPGSGIDIALGYGHR